MTEQVFNRPNQRHQKRRIRKTGWESKTERSWFWLQVEKMIFQHCFALQNPVKGLSSFQKKNKTKCQNHGSC